VAVNMELWETYFRLKREAALRGDMSARDAMRFYEEIAKKWIAGRKSRGRIGMIERFARWFLEISGIQRVMNIRCETWYGFVQAEIQNEPGAMARIEVREPELIARRVSGRPQFEVPDDCRHLVRFIDVHARTSIIRHSPAGATVAERLSLWNSRYERAGQREFCGSE